MRTAVSRAAASLSLSRKPAAPARSAPKTYSSRSNVVSTRTSARLLGDDLAGGGDPVEPGHLDVHEDEVGAQLAGEPYRLLAVRRLADDLDVGGGAQDEHQPGAYGGLVLGDEDPDRLRGWRLSSSLSPPRGPPGGHSARTSQNRPAGPFSGPASNAPPSRAIRSRIPTRPAPEPGARGRGRSANGLLTVTVSAAPAVMGRCVPAPRRVPRA